MAERIISPGVFTREKDLSFLPAGIAQLGAAIVGPTLTGPAMVPIQVTSYSDFENKFGTQDPSNYTAYTAKSYLQRGGAPSATIIRTLGNGGFQLDRPLVLTLTGSTITTPTVAAVLMPTIVSSSLATTLSASFSVSGSIKTGSLQLSGSSATYSISLNPTDSNYITKVFGTSPTGDKPVYVALEFKEFLSSSYSVAAITASIIASSSSTPYIASGSAYGKYGFTEAKTPWITDQDGNKLFRFHTIADGSDTNKKYKISIVNIKTNDISAGGDDTTSTYYTSFTVQLRKFDDTDSRPNIIESFSDLNLNKNSVNYIARRIGDRYLEFGDNGKVLPKGNYANLSQYIYIEMYDLNDTYHVSRYPFGFANLYKPFNGTLPTASFITNLSGSDGQQNARIYYGFDFSKVNNLQYINPSIVSSVSSTDFVANTGNTFSLSSCTSSAGSTVTISTSRSELKFTVPFQAGFDGMSPYTNKNVGLDITSTNVFGFNLSSATSTGTLLYKDALNILSNPDEIDINLLLLPGIFKQYHSSVTNAAITMCEDRGDVFYVMDSVKLDASITDAVNEVSAVDSNYCATYYPWVKIVDENLNRPVWVSPSVVVAGAIAFNDRVGFEWTTPAGLNRGGLTEVVEAYTRLTREERDTLYEGRVNPIATFPGQGVSAWGQKTLQAKPSALDRMNVRRLLINLKKYIASTSRYLVFEQNTAATRARFLNIVNPYLESVRSRSGLTAFRVVMDETNNTAEVIDRNQLVGQIYIQPTRTAEFVVLDFVVLPTGATFPV